MFPNHHTKEIVQTLYTRFVKHGYNGAININRAKFSEAVKRKKNRVGTLALLRYFRIRAPSSGVEVRNVNKRTCVYIFGGS